MVHTHIARAALLAALAFAGLAGAQTPAAAPTPAAAAAPMADGEIRKIDKDNRKLTIKHGPLASLEMPGMTMVFGVADAALLDKVQVGSKVKFQAAKVDGKLLVTAMEVAGP